MTDATPEQLARVRARILAIREAMRLLSMADLDAICEQRALRDGDQTAAAVWREHADLHVLEHDRALGRP